MTRVVIVGLDGATLDLMDPWMNEGKLPTFQKIRDQGVYGRLRSTTPYYSAPAWVSIVTGCQPGKHGIYDFFRTDTYKKSIVSSRHRKVPAIWNILTQDDKKSLVVNVPGTYPPERIDGVMITGLLTPSPESHFTYPDEIKKDLVPEKLGTYLLEQVAVDDIPKNLTARYAPEKLALQINEMTLSHATVTMNLMRMNNWDFSMVVFRGTDDVQHLLWDRKDLILSCYQKADECLGHMMQQYPDALFVVVSDHGFGKPKKYFYVNNALYNAGYLKTTSNPSTSISTLISMVFDKLSRLIFHFVPVQKIVRSPMGRKLILSSASVGNIDISRTIAMYHSVCSRGIRINVKEKYPYGIIDKMQYEAIRNELIGFLKGITDPDTGEHIVEKVYTFEEIYGKDALNDPLDIIFDLKDGYSAQELLQPPEGLRAAFQSKKDTLSFVSSPGFYDWVGDHKPHGILFMYGKDILLHRCLDASVLDVVPTVLAALQTPIPRHIDGRVLTEAFLHPPTVSYVKERTSEESLLTPSELAVIRKLRKKF
jgi:predicted AlkP superfamily phosphohydrolase/phosphomutase